MPSRSSLASPLLRSSRSTWLPSLLALACTTAGCVESEEPVDEGSLRSAEAQADVEADAAEIAASGESVPADSLPVLGPDEAVETFIQLLPSPTAHGENVAVHLKLPPPGNGELADSLVRVIGGPEESPLLLFRTDVLVEKGLVSESPGPEFFTAFVELDLVELEERVMMEEQLAATESASSTTILFKGRTPFAITTGIALDTTTFFGGGVVALGACPLKPASVLARWGESLLITDPAVVQDPDRTNDVCGSPGNPDGVWTFKHLMNEMAIGSGLSTHDFVVDWLENWLNDAVINGDHIPARTQMFHQVIQPWANASGVVATLTTVGGTNVLNLSGPLDLDLSPFRLSAIVNRIDLGRTTTFTGYGGTTTSAPLDAGELRFVFGVQNLDTCQQLLFSVIFEYGVPIHGCNDVQKWAREWTELNDGVNLPAFSDAWRDHLESLTQSVVVHGAAPGRGNDNAINQIRTNEIALDGPWELREFTLSTEDLTSTNAVPPGTPDVPASGPLLAHTVAMTPDDSVFGPSSTAVDDFVQNFVLPNVIGAGTPGDCGASYVVPADHPTLGGDFRGGNAFTAPPTHWVVNVGTTAAEKCARHQFSLNTCSGCHFGDTATGFFHIDPLTMPAGLSNFLTGGSLGVWSVPDPQFTTPSWQFADLDRRFHRLYQIACEGCGNSFALSPSAFEQIAELAGVVPIDIGPGIEAPFPTGPIVDSGVVDQLLLIRNEIIDPTSVTSVQLDGMVRPIESFAH